MNQFGTQSSGNEGGGLNCAACEAMLTDAVDGILTPEQQAKFDMHLLGCVDCAATYEDAQRGAAWLEMLKSDRPLPSENLMARILAETSGLPAPSLVQPVYAGSALPVVPQGFGDRVASWFNLRGMGQALLQPRLAMTAAMAFFSVALTLNLTGVKVTELRVSDLSPSSLKRTFYQTNARVVRYYDNLRVVYELESRVKELRQSDDRSNNQDQNQAQPADDSKKQNNKKNQPTPGRGSSRKDSPIGSFVLTAQADEQSVYLFHSQAVPCVASLSGMPERGVA